VRRFVGMDVSVHGQADWLGQGIRQQPEKKLGTVCGAADICRAGMSRRQDDSRIPAFALRYFVTPLGRRARS